MADYNWNELSKRLLKSELVKRGISHEELAYRLNEIGIKETKSGIDSKICRGTFSASFFLQCLSVIGCNNLILQSELLIAADSNVEYRKKVKYETN
jgi:hypothetical protein